MLNMSIVLKRNASLSLEYQCGGLQDDKNIMFNRKQNRRFSHVSISICRYVQLLNCICIFKNTALLTFLPQAPPTYNKLIEQYYNISKQKIKCGTY